MKNESARIAFVGAGCHATESLYPNIAHIPEFDLVAVCDLDEGKARSAAKRFGAPRHFTDLDSLLEQTELDGVCACGPPQMHFEVAGACLAKDLPVFVEKPPAPDSASCEELLKCARAGGAFCMVGFMKRFAPANRVAAEVMSKPDFGALSTVSLVHGSGPYDDVYRMMIFNGIHMIDLAFFFGGDIESVSARSSQAEGSAKALAVNFAYASGAVGTLNMNSAHSWQDCYEEVYVSGTGEAIYIDASKACEVMSSGRRFADGKGLELFGWSGRYYVSGNMAGWWAGGHYTRGYWGELDRFAKACLGRAAPTPTLEDALKAMRFIDAALASASQGGHSVDLPH